MSVEQNRKGVWKSGRGKGRRTPKGRQLDEQALDQKSKRFWATNRAVVTC